MRSPFSAFALLYIVNKCINNNVVTRPVNSVVGCDISTKTSENSQLMLSIPKYLSILFTIKKTNKPTLNTAELQKYVPNFSKGKVCCLKQRIQVQADRFKNLLYQQKTIQKMSLNTVLLKTVRIGLFFISGCLYFQQKLGNARD